MDAASLKVPFFRLELDDEDMDAVSSVLRSGWLTTGPQVASFEQEFAQFIGPDVLAVAVSSNTAGMHLVLEALGIGPAIRSSFQLLLSPRLRKLSDILEPTSSSSTSIRTPSA